ncbi:HAAS domain-containing protein [Sporolactobacillus terrae]|uniref:HAAS transmembrane region domain-containing protein n=1 Tax=Sporolactobacillus terrae TaxID=269673 RepID=A0A5K7X0X2_9BACL|nr:hypothetical protein [Sporolactobacillus terrae]BBN97706.1 hypothetical protein St703_04110 [Sporolactobacillus terrae]
MKKLSKESREFLQDLRLYLFSSGKKENEIEDLVGELEDHLCEAEKHGKSVKTITGSTPKEYMDQLANEMPFDYRNVWVYGPMILLGLICYNLLNKAVDGVFTYSLVEVSGDLFITLLGLSLLLVLFKYLASSTISKMKEHLLLYGCSLTPIILFVGLFYLDRAVASPTIHLGTMWRITSVVLACLFLIGIAVWAKTWVSIVIPISLLLPELILNQTGMDGASKSGWSMLLTFLGIALYFFIVFKQEKKKGQSH